MSLSLQDYRSRVLGCWLGKNIGGTLGAPFEWRRQVNDVSFYTQDLRGEPLPNDDLDIQLLWLVALEERGIGLNAATLADYWCLYVTPHWSEYGTAKVQMRAGLPPPLCGDTGNEFRDSCGAFIRSEIWACIAPGLPKLAAQYALADASLDHGGGEGSFAAVFCAALESAAFAVADLPALLEIGLSYIPEGCGTAGAIRCAMASHAAGRSWQEARDAVLQDFRGGTFFGHLSHTSEADRKKGFHEGKRGWDAPSNLGLLAVALLYGEGDFARTVCVAVNCGEDTDCTAATAGSIFGILHGAAAIPDAWVKPIGRTIKTACLNLGELGYFGNQLPQNVDALTVRTEQVMRQVMLRHAPNLEPVAEFAVAPAVAPVSPESLHAGAFRDELWASSGGPVFTFDFFKIGVDYGHAGVFVRDGQPRPLRVWIRNTYKVQAVLHLTWHLPEGWSAAPARTGTVLSLPGHLCGGRPVELEFVFTPAALNRPLARLILEIVCDSRPTVMLVPVVFRNGNFQPG